MDYLAWALPFVIAGVCCVQHQIWQVGYSVNRQNIVSANGNEDQRGQDSCKWENPPENGFNFWPCSKGWCSDKVGNHKRNGTLRFTRCDSSYVLVGGSDGDTCVNGQWTSGGHQCIPCGRSQNTFNPLEDLALIQNGHISSRGDFPWMVALYNTLQTDEWHQICGGTLISPNLVLTAAHCLINGGKNFKADEVMVGLGKLRRSFYREESSSVITSVEEIIRPERYLGADHLFDLDIALLVLEKSVATGDYIMPACMDWGATMEPKHDEVGYLAGWGDTAGVNTPSEVLKWATQRYVQYNECKKLTNQTYWKLITHDKFCVASVKGGMADKGDSGGGLTMLRDGVHYVYGVLSTKLSLHDQNVRLFTNVLNGGHFLWLRQHWQRLLLRQPSGSKANSEEREPAKKPNSEGDIITAKPPTVTRANSKEMCKRYAEFVKKNCTDDKPSMQDIPYMALIGYGVKNPTSWLCDGTLISERFVMSAGICSRPSNAGSPKWVLLGGYYKSTTAGSGRISSVKQLEIVETIVHPDYEYPSTYNNLALFRLEKDVEFNEHIWPICLHTEHQRPQTNTIATNSLTNARHETFLRNIDWKIISGKNCIDDIKRKFEESAHSRFPDGIKDNSILCADDPVYKEEFCEHESGGPLRLRLNNRYCIYSQIGISLLGTLFRSGIPRIFTRVSYFVPWIESIVWPDVDTNSSKYNGFLTFT